MRIKELIKKALSVYKHNFMKLFLPILALQLAVLLPLLFFTLPGTMNIVRALFMTIKNYTLGGQLSRPVFYVLVYILCALLFLSPLVVNNTVYIIEYEQKPAPVSFRKSVKFAFKNYMNMLRTYGAVILLAIPVFAVDALLIFASVDFKAAPPALKPFAIPLLAAAAALFALFLLGTVFMPYIVATCEAKGFAAVKRSFGIIYNGRFSKNLARLASGAAMAGAALFAVNMLSQLPFGDLVELYLIDPKAAAAHPLMGVAAAGSIGALFVAALIIPFWYAFTYNTYLDAKQDYKSKILDGEG